MSENIKKTRRNNKRYPGINRTVNLKTRQDEIDYDYINQLTDEEKDWLSRFTDEYVGANFTHEGKRIHATKYKTKKVKKTGKRRKIDIYKKECEDRNNARNRCEYTRAKAGGFLDEGFSNDVKEQCSTNHHDVENSLIERLDAEAELSKEIEFFSGKNCTKKNS